MTSSTVAENGVSFPPSIVVATTREGDVAGRPLSASSKNSSPTAKMTMMPRQNQGCSGMGVARKSTEENKKGNDSSNDSNRKRDTIPFLKSEDLTFFFTSMTWNADLLTVLLSKAPNPLHNINGQELVEVKVECGEEASQRSAAYPSIEEALQVGTASRGKNRHAGNSHARRSRRRKVCRGREIPLRLPCVFSYAMNTAGLSGVGEEEEEEGGWNCNNDNTLSEPHGRGAADTAVLEGSYDTYITEGEEEEVDGDHAPRRCLDTIATVTASIADTTPPQVRCEEGGSPPHTTIRDFLRIFYQCFIIVVAAQVQQKRDHQELQQDMKVFDSYSLSNMEKQSLLFLHRHLEGFKRILRQYVMCNEREVERRGAQPLLVGGFRRPTAEGGRGRQQKLKDDSLAPHYGQVYLSGKEPVYQPLLLDMLDITRVVQCYADQLTSEYGDTNNAKKSMALSVLCSWRQLLLEGTGSSLSEVPGGLFLLCNEEWVLARELFSRCLSPLLWKFYRPLGPYMVYTAQLSLSNRCLTKLVLPAEDRESYDLSVHFQDYVFRFIHGMPLPSLDSIMRAKLCGLSSQCCLVQCSAGMHRSSGVATAYLLWLAALSGRKFPITESSSHPSSQELRLSVSYLSAVLGHRQLCHEISGSAAESGEGRDSAAEVDLAIPKSCSIVERCIQHVRKQRTMAVPIAAVQEQLRLYARLLDLD